MISCDLQAIVTSNDPSVLGTLPAWLKSMGVRPIIHRQAATALQTVTRQRVDAVFMDWDLDRDFSGLQEIRATATGRRLVGMAIISPQAPVRDAFRVSDFILEKPLFQQRVLQTLRAAHGIMVRDRMQYTRLPLETEATVFNRDARSFSAVATNVSQTGIALQSNAQSTNGEIVQIHFRLPKVANTIACRAKAIWSDNRTRAGFSFLEMKSSDREALSTWIEQQFIAGWQQQVPAVQPGFIIPATQAMAATELRSA